MSEKLQQTIKLDGKIYALECTCRERGGHNYWERMCRTETTFPTEKTPGKLYYDPNLMPFCPKCYYFPWIIVAKK